MKSSMNWKMKMYVTTSAYSVFQFHMILYIYFQTKLIEADAEAAETIKTSKRERAKVIINLQEDLK